VTTTQIVGSGRFTYEMHEDWAKVPTGWEMPAAAVCGDSQDRIYCFNRDRTILSSSSIGRETTCPSGERGCSRSPTLS